MVFVIDIWNIEKYFSNTDIHQFLQKIFNFALMGVYLSLSN